MILICTYFMEMRKPNPTFPPFSKSELANELPPGMAKPNLHSAPCRMMQEPSEPC